MSEIHLGALVSRTLGGGTPSRTVADFWLPEVPWASVKDVSAGGRNLQTTEESISRKGLKASPASLVEPGMPIIAMRMAVGSIASFAHDVAINQDLRALIPSQGVDKAYLYYLLQSLSAKVSSLAVGSTVKGIRLGQLINLPVPLPPAPEVQRRIADLLSAVDGKIEMLEMQAKKETNLMIGMLQSLLPEGFQVELPPRGRLEQALEYVEAGKSFMCSEKAAPSGSWGVLKVSAVRPDGFVSEENKQVENLDLVNPRYEVKDGDLLITRANTPELVGAACLVVSPQPRLLLCDKTLRLRYAPTATPHYLWLWLQTPVARRHLEAHATGTSAGMKNISQSAIKAIPLELPSRDVQERRVAPLVAQLQYISTLRAEAAKIRSYRNGLLRDLLSGGMTHVVDS